MITIYKLRCAYIAKGESRAPWVCVSVTTLFNLCSMITSIRDNCKRPAEQPKCNLITSYITKWMPWHVHVNLMTNRFDDSGDNSVYPFLVLLLPPHYSCCTSTPPIIPSSSSSFFSSFIYRFLFVIISLFSSVFFSSALSFSFLLSLSFSDIELNFVTVKK